MVVVRVFWGWRDCIFLVVYGEVVGRDLEVWEFFFEGWEVGGSGVWCGVVGVV